MSGTKYMVDFGSKSTDHTTLASAMRAAKRLGTHDKPACVWATVGNPGNNNYRPIACVLEKRVLRGRR